MVALSSLLYLAPVLLALGSTSAAPTPDDVSSMIDAHRAVIEAYRADHTDAPPAPAAAAAVAAPTAPAASPVPTAPAAPAASAAVQDPKDILAARQYDPTKPKGPQRIVRRALNSVQPAPNSVSNNGVHLAKFYEGVGYTETDHNPTNVQTPSETTFPSTLGVPQAIQACADYSVGQNNWAFQLYFLGSQDTWVCRGYFNNGPRSDASYFKDSNADVLVAYGYQN